MRDLLGRLTATHANLRARGMVTASEDMNAAIGLCERALLERDEARVEMKRIKALDVEIGRLKYQNVQLNKALSEARDEAKKAAIPMDEAREIARAEVRALLKPYLTDGAQGMRMLALTIAAELNARWGKE